jgi:nucleoid-associated protein YgaU
MSKDVIIAGAIAAGCVALVAVALLAPKSHKDEPAKTSDAPVTTAAPDPFAPLPGDLALGPGTASATAFGPGSLGTGTGAVATAFPPAGTGAAGGGFGATSGQGTGGMGNAPGFGPAITSAPATPEPVAAPVAAGPSSTTEHVVASGETLGDISLKYYKSSKQWKRIVDANPGLDPRTLRVGQKLKITLDQPAAGAVGTAVAAPTAGPGERTYTIKAKDSLYGIAKRELGSGGRWKEITALNPGLDHNDLKVGRVIKLPAAAGTGAATTGGAEASPAAAGARTHVVAKGETLADISKKYFGTSKRYKEIVAANPGVSPEALKVGQKLVIPESAAKTSATGTTESASATAAEGEYTVKAGDTPAAIAKTQIGGADAVQKLLAANPGLNPKALRIGQKLKIPGKAAPAAATTTPAPAAMPATPMPPIQPAPANQPIDPWATPAGGFGATTGAAAGAPGAPADFGNPYANTPDAWAAPAAGTPAAGSGAGGR